MGTISWNCPHNEVVSLAFRIMADAKIDDLPSEVLVCIFDFVIYSFYDINEYLLLREKGIARIGTESSRRQLVSTRRLTLRLVCQYFRHILDSATFWSKKTIIVSKKSLERRLWTFYKKIGVRSIVVSVSWPPTCNRRPNFYVKLSTLSNLRHLTYSCRLDEYSFELLSCLSSIPLQTIELLDAMQWHVNCDHVKKSLESLRIVLSRLSRSLRKVTIQGDMQSPHFSSYYQCYQKSINGIEMVINKHSLVSKLKETLPVLQTVTLRHFYDGNTFCFRTKSFLEQSLHFLRTVNSVILVEKLQGNYREFNCGANELFSDCLDERFEENKQGLMEMRSLSLVVHEDTFKDSILFKEMVNVKQVIILKSSAKKIEYTSAVIHWKMLETIVLGSLIDTRTSSNYSLFVPFPVFPSIVGTLQCFSHLAKVHFYMQAMLTNEDIDTISRSNGISLKEMYLDVCPNIDDLSLYSINTRFQNLLRLAVLDCHGIKGTFLQQNYYKFETVPKLKWIKLRLMNDSDPILIINVIELVRTHSNNKVELLVL